MASRGARTKPATALRKAPRQARSGATFDAIVEAAARILSAEGPGGLTTNRIARRAGVSVGSLYQYFPNKHAIVRALLEREVARAEALRPARLEDPGCPLEERIRAAVDWHCDIHSADPALARALHRLVDESLPRSERAALAALRAMRTQSTIADTPRSRRDPERATFVVEVCLDALVDAALRRRPDWLASETFRAELATLLSRYLAAES